MLMEQIIGADGVIRTKLDIAIQRLKSFEPPEGYFLAFSGGKDSQCIYHLARKSCAGGYKKGRRINDDGYQRAVSACGYGVRSLRIY